MIDGGDRASSSSGNNSGDTVNGASSRSTNDNGHYSKISSPSLVKNKSGVMNGKVSLTPPSNKRKKVGVLRAYTCPMDPDYHPELDETPLLNGSDISIFRMLIGR